MNPLTNFSPHLFWDVKKESLDLHSHKGYIIKQVLEYGLYEDWKIILAYYGIEQIKNVVLSFRELEPKALNLIAVLSNTPRENFRCYTTKQSANPHWNF